MEREQNKNIDPTKPMKFHKISKCRYCGYKPEVVKTVFKYGVTQKYQHTQLIARVRYIIECSYCGAYVAADAPFEYKSDLYKSIIRYWNEMNCNWKKGL